MILDDSLRLIVNSKYFNDYVKCEAVWNEKDKIIKQNHITGLIRPYLADIVGVSDSTMKCVHYIMSHGTEEQKSRARRGGEESDGRKNTITNIAVEIRHEIYPPSNNKPYGETRICKVCGKELPIDRFELSKGYRLHTCRTCRMLKYKEKNYGIKPREPKNDDFMMTEEQLNDYLYNADNEVKYTIDDLIEEILINGKNGIKSVETSLDIHSDLLTTEENKKKAIESLKTLSHRLYELQLRFREN